ncbi:MAG: N-acetylglucosamine-6-phosphate deacetylase [Pirellula sp.]
MYFDIQVNGAFGVDFNDSSLTFDQFQMSLSQLRGSGVEKLLPTIITDDVGVMCARIRKLVDFKKANTDVMQMVAGIHVEGPFLSPIDGFRGTHPREHIAKANVEYMERLLEAGQGLVRLVTLAPEHDYGFETLRYLVSQNVCVFAGHTDASHNCLIKAIDQGLAGFTHLGNGCPLEVHRHDNIIQRVLALSDRLYISLIGDGVHLPVWLLESWLKRLPTNKVILTSDSMSAAGMPPGEYLIGGQPILVDAERRTRHRDHQYLAGSASTLQDIDRVVSGMHCSHSDKILWFRENAASLFY